jgi:DNA-3-methyladenine glycosylase I
MSMTSRINNLARTESLNSDNNRCPWSGSDPLYISYHDKEWGVPVYDDRVLFEFLVLEGAQAGLSWITVLKKREAYRNAFDNFDPVKVSAYSRLKIDNLMNMPALIRNRKKLESAVKNASAFVDVQQKYGSFSNFFWRYSDGSSIINHWRSMSEIPASTPLSEKISNDMKKKGFSFVGPTIIYSMMQAVGMVNDHLVSCFRHYECQRYI